MQVPMVGARAVPLEAAFQGYGEERGRMGKRERENVWGDWSVLRRVRKKRN